MKAAARRRWWLPILVALLAVVAGLATWAGARALELARVGGGYAAKQVCSGVFVSGRGGDDVIRHDVAEVPGFVRIRVDRERGVVSAGTGPLRREAVYRAGLGCTLVHDGVPEPNPGRARAVAAGTPLAEAAADDPLRQGLRPGIDAAFDEPDPATRRGTRAVIVVHRGRIVAERYAAGFDAAMPLAGWSMAKGAVNALAGILVAEDRLALTDGVPGWEDATDGREDITVRHLLQMTSGLAFVEDYADPGADVVRMLFDEPDAAAVAARQPMMARPGERWHYASGTTNLLMAVMRDRFADADEWLAFPRRALFEPLGMRAAVMEPDATGNPVGSSFMYATARDWVRLGRLYLDDGYLDGERLLPAGWVEFTRRPVAAAPKGRYGAHFWLNAGDPDTGERHWPAVPEDALIASGFREQRLVIVPSRDLVILRLGLTAPRGSWDAEAFVAAIVDRVDRITGPTDNQR